MPVTREQFDNDPFIRGLPDDQQAFLRRRYLDTQVRPALKAMSQAQRAPILDSWAAPVRGEAGTGAPAVDTDSGFFSTMGKTVAQDMETGDTMTARTRGALLKAQGVDDMPVMDKTIVPQGPAAAAGQLVGHELAMIGDPASWLAGGAAGKVAGKALAGSTSVVGRTMAKAPRLVTGSAAGGTVMGGSEGLRQYNTGEFDPARLAEETGKGLALGAAAGAAGDLAAHVPGGRLNPVLGRPIENEHPAVRPGQPAGSAPATMDGYPIPQDQGATHIYAPSENRAVPVRVVEHQPASAHGPARLILDDGTSRFPVAVDDPNLFDIDAVNRANALPPRPSTALVPSDTINVPEGGFETTRRPPVPDALTDQVGQRPPGAPAIEPPARETFPDGRLLPPGPRPAGLLPPAGWRSELPPIPMGEAGWTEGYRTPSTTALVPVNKIDVPPGGFKAAPPAPETPARPSAFTDQVGARPPARPVSKPAAFRDTLSSGSHVIAPAPGTVQRWTLPASVDRATVLQALARGEMPPPEVLAQHPDIAAKVEELGPVAPPAPAGGGPQPGGARAPRLAKGKAAAPQRAQPAPPSSQLDFFSQLFNGEEGSASVEGAAGLPLAVAASVPRAALGAARAVARPLGAANRAVDTALGAVADATGLTRLGNRMADAGVHVLREAGNDSTRAIPGTNHTVGEALKTVRGYTQSDANLPAGYADLRDVTAPAQADALLRPVAAKAQEIRQGMDAVTQEALHDAITGGADTPEANAVRDLVDPVSQTLYDVGNLTREQYEAWAGRYLPRLYEKYLKEMPAVAQLMRSASSFLKGSPSRGKLRTMDAEDLDIFGRDWQIAGATPEGKVALEDSHGARIEVPEKHVGDYLGVWKPLRRVGEKTVAWRDWTPDERANMGEVKDVALALDTLVQRSYTDLKNGLLLQEIAKNPEWARPTSQGKPHPDWVHLDNRSIPGRDLPRWGALADHYVHPGIARDLHSSMVVQQFMDQIPLWSEGMGAYKRAKTILNPSFYVNNIMQNFPVLELAGGNAFTFPEAVHEMATGGQVHQQAEALGLYRDSGVAREVAQRLGRTPLDGSNMLGMAMKLAQTAEEMGTRFSQASDDVFKLALVMEKTRQGMPMADAVKYANATFYDSSRVNSPLARVAASTTHPFIKPFLHYGVKLPELIARNPAKAAKLVLYQYAASKVLQALNGETDQDEAARDALVPEYLKGNNARLPGQDGHGQQVIIDMKNWGAGNVFDTSDRTAAPSAVDVPGLTDLTGVKLGVPQALIPSGPIATGFALKSNFDDFRGKAIRNTATPLGQQLEDVAGYVAKDMGPGFVGTAQKVASAVNGTTDPGGRRYDLPTALANVVGIKAQPFDPESARLHMNQKYVHALRDIEDVIEKAGRDRAAGRISPEEFEAIRDAQLTLRTQTLAEWHARQDAATPARKGVRPPRLVTGRASGTPAGQAPGGLAADIDAQRQRLLSTNPL